MSELTEAIKDQLPADFESHIRDPNYNEETAAKNYGVQILQLLGLENASYEQWISGEHRPDFIWESQDGTERLVGEFKAPWDEHHSPSNPQYKLNEGIDQCKKYNQRTNVPYILVTDGRWILLKHVLSKSETEYKLDLLEAYRNPNDPEVEQNASTLSEQLTTIYGGFWNEEPSQRDISDDEIFDKFIDVSVKSLYDDLLPSIKQEFERYQDRYNEYIDEKEEHETRLQKSYDKYISMRDDEAYVDVIERLYQDPYFDYVSYLDDADLSGKEVDLTDRAKEFADRHREIERKIDSLNEKYRLARNWYHQWNRWLTLRGINFEEKSQSDQENLKETFQLQTLNVLYNRLLIIRIFEDMGMIGRLISDGFIKTFDEKTRLQQGNRYEEPLTAAKRQASEVYEPLFERNTPHDWYHYEESVLKTILRRFDNFNFKNIDRDIFGEMYQRCLEPDERKKLGSYYTPPEVINFLLDYTGHTPDSRQIRATRSQEGKNTILDPASGSGTFLLEYFKRFLEAEKDAGRDLSDPRTIEKLVRRIQDKLHGFDIDPFAVQLAQSNLLVYLMREKRRAEEDSKSDAGSSDSIHLELPQFPIYETDSLLTLENPESSDDDTSENGSTHETLEQFYRAHEPNPNPEHLENVIDAKSGKHALVMGNPPYVRYHNQSNIDEQYAEFQATLNKDSDIYDGFVEQALKWTEEGGQVAFVISDRFLVNQSSEDIRKYVLENAKIELVVDLARSKVFGYADDDTNVFPLLLVLTKTEDEEERLSNEITVGKVFVKGSYEDRAWAPALELVAADIMDADPPEYDFSEDYEASDETYAEITNSDVYKTYTVSQSRLMEKQSEWSKRHVLNTQITDELWDIVLQMENNDSKRLDELTQLNNEGTTVTRGGGSSDIRPYRTSEDNPNAAPVVSGGNVDEFLLQYEPNGDGYVDYEQLQSDFTGEDTEVEMSKRKAEVILNEEVIVWEYTNPELTFAVDGPADERRFLKRRIYFLRPNENGLDQFTENGDIYDHHYICGLLNSNLLDFYYKAYYEHKAFRHGTQIDMPAKYLEHLPIYIPSEEERKHISNISEKLHELQQERVKLENQKDSLYSQFEVDGKLVQFRDFIQRTEKEHSTHPLKTLNLSRTGKTLQLNQSFVVELYTEEDAKQLKNFLDTFGDKFDKEQFIGGRLDDLYLPSDLEKFADEYTRLGNEIEQKEQQIEQKKNKLNDEVYKLYGISEDKQNLIEEYLADFLTKIK